jgi:hypothetical protein
MLCRDRWRPASPGQLLRAGRRRSCSAAREHHLRIASYQMEPCPGRSFCSLLSKRNEPFQLFATLMG